MAYIGVIEGFYGKQFKDEVRCTLFDALKAMGGSFYIYAPKEERALRQDLMRGVMGEKKLLRLEALKQKCADVGLDFGLALSPYNLTVSYDSIKDKFLAIVRTYATRLQPEIFCLLFDDQTLEGCDSATVQNCIVKDVCDLLPDSVKRFIICPTYYTFDPLLDKLFGKRPDDYFKKLCVGLPERVEIFWTGNKVVSPAISTADLEAATEVLGRKPFIWDNYPVNDGKNISQFLFLKPFGPRRNLEHVSSGHAINPMLQGVLNIHIWQTLFAQYQGLDDTAIQERLTQDLTAQLGAGAYVLIEQLHLLTDKGLNNLNALQKAMLIAACELEPKNAALNEIKAFLQGKYAFDPACLT